MACKVISLLPNCGYNIEGIESIRLLHFEDFVGFKFNNDGLYDSAFVTGVLRSGEFIELQTPDSAKFTSTLSKGIYTYSLETFISELTAVFTANLHLATKKRFIVIFQTKAGHFHAFGYESGAAVNYSSQTAEATGSLVTITAASVYPLFQVSAAALQGAIVIKFVPDFEANAVCEQNEDDENTGYLQATVAYKVDQVTNAPLDIDGNLVSDSGQKQAIQILIGTSNPNPALYEVQATFAAGATLTGNPTRQLNTTACPVTPPPPTGIYESQYETQYE